MPAYYMRSLSDFLSDSTSSIIGELAQANAAALFKLEPEAIDAWRDQLPSITSAVRRLLAEMPTAGRWHILLEYPIPMVGRRIDAVLLAGNIIIVIETKTGASRTSAVRQVEDYSINLACFHEPSAGRKIIPFVISDSEVSGSSERTTFDRLIEPCQVCNKDDVAERLVDACELSAAQGGPQVDPDTWNRGRFRPVPSIVRAAVALYSDMNVFEIGHSCAAREDLNTTTQAILTAVEQAQRYGEKVICFVTGVPGAGKTLVGLNAVHAPSIRDVGSFLSGNGPLVRVIQEALVRDVTRRISEHAPKNRRQAELEVRAFVHSVHRFADEYYREDKKQPAQKVVIFDEAQRAWDSAQNKKKKRPEVSEAQMMLEIMDRHDDWAVLIALIGGGQEINSGEAGLAEWGRALTNFPEWKIAASPVVLDSAQNESGFCLFENTSFENSIRVRPSEALHLRVSNRSIRAQQISDWVNAVLEGHQLEAQTIAGQMQVTPTLTRSLGFARRWLEGNRRGTTRSGLVTSATSTRLRADGLEPTFGFHQDFDWEHWFLDTADCELSDCDHKYCNDVRASSKLEVAATQFEIQGLELDWVGVCWGEDLLWEGDRWECRKFNNKAWKVVPQKSARKRTYLKNAYRVLMTRARQSMILYIPKPLLEDGSRMHSGLDHTAEFLRSCGAQLVEP
jgi:hypothetical protein